MSAPDGAEFVRIRVSIRASPGVSSASESGRAAGLAGQPAHPGPSGHTQRVRRFDVAGPVGPEVHYAVPPLSRLDLPRILGLVESRAYFVLHAPRQTGKTSVLGALRERLAAEGWRSVYASIESGRMVGGDREAAVRGILSAIGEAAAACLDDDSMEDIWPGELEKRGPADAIGASLARWAQMAGGERLVLLLDEVDGLDEDTLFALLSQLRARFGRRPHRFPRCVVLCGLRDLRDCPLGDTGSFNIVTESLRLPDFSRGEVEGLLGQHTQETGQEFAPDAVEEIWDATSGQPWLVNALARDVCFENEAGRDRSRTIEKDAVVAARDRLILDSPIRLRHFADQLKEPRVRRVIEPILAGRAQYLSTERADLAYVRALGLTKANGEVEIANPIYREVVPRLLSVAAESRLSADNTPFLRADRRLDVPTLLAAFQGFFREHSEWWAQGFSFREAAVQVLLQAFLQRIVNAGGRIVRKYALGMGRSDLLIEWRASDRLQRFVVECKVRREHDSLETVIREGAAQTARYLDRCDAEEGHLVVIDDAGTKTWEEKIFERSLSVRRTADPDAPQTWEVTPDSPSAEGAAWTIRIWGM